MKSLLLGTVAVFALSGLFPAFSAETNELRLAPVVVSATRSAQSRVTTPASITVITHDEIKRSGAHHITELLTGRAGVQLIDSSGDGTRPRISMRGFGADNANANVLVLVDGRRLTNPDLGTPNINTVSLKDVEQIEIIEGSAGSLFGDQAVGGVINIITRGISRSGANAAITRGSYSSQNLNLAASQYNKDSLSYRVSTEIRDSHGYRENNESDYTNFSARISHPLADGEWFAEMTTIDEFIELPGALTKAQLEADRRQSTKSDFNDSKFDTWRLGARLPIGKQWQFEGEFTAREDKIHAEFPDFFFSSDLKRDVRSLNPRIVGALPGKHGDTQLTFGLDLDKSFYDGGFGQHIDQYVRAAFAQAVIPLSQTVSATVGARRAEVDNQIVDGNAFPAGVSLKDEVTVAEVGVSWNLTPEWRLFARRDENFRFAKVDEQTYTSPGIVGLDTQTGKSLEMGAEWKKRGHSIRIQVYQLDLENEISFDPSAPMPVFGFFDGANVNLDPTRRRGLLLEGHYLVSREVAVNGQITYLEGNVDGGLFKGNAIPFAAEKQLRAGIDYRINDAWRLFAEAVYTSSRFQDGDFENALEKLPSQTVANANLTYFQNDLRIQTRVNNLTGEEYSSYATFNGFTSGYYPAPETNIMVTLAIDWN